MQTIMDQYQTLKFLTSSQKDSYLKNGFLIIDDFIRADICQSLIQRMKILIEDFNPDEIKTVFHTKDQRHTKQHYFLNSSDKIHFFFEEDAFDENGNLKYEKALSINKVGHALHDLDPTFNSFSRQHKIALLAEDLGLMNSLLVQSMYICKQPYIGGEVTCHQDATYLFAKKKPVIGLWFALEDATLENGCLWAIPGGHHSKLKSRLIRQGYETKLEIYDDTPWSLDKMVPLEAPRGSLIILDGLLPHMSKGNFSDRSRHAYTLHLADINGEFATDNWLQREIFIGF